MEIDCELGFSSEVSPWELGAPLASSPAASCVPNPAASSKCMMRRPRPRPAALSPHLVAESEEPADVPARPQVPRANAPKPSLQSSLCAPEAPPAEQKATPASPRSPTKHRVTQLLASALGRTKFAKQGVEPRHQRSAAGWFRKAAGISDDGDVVLPGPSVAFRSADLEVMDVVAF